MKIDLLEFIVAVFIVVHVFGAIKNTTTFSYESGKSIQRFSMSFMKGFNASKEDK